MPGRATTFLAAFALAIAPVLAVPARDAHAQGTDGFVAVDDLVARRAPSRVVLFSLPDGFDACLPLTTACPSDSSSLLVVSARGRRIVWLPESTELRAVRLSGDPVPAVGSPPTDAATARYLLPVVDGTGAGLVFTPRGLVDGRFTMAVPDGSDASDPSEREPYVPVLAGPSLGGAPSGAEPEPLLSDPVIVDADELDETVPVLVVRRASPSRVVFAVLPDPAWRMTTAVLPLLGEDGIAGLVRHDGRVRLAVPAPGGVDIDPVATATTRAGDTTAADEESGIGLGALLAIVGAVVAGATTALWLRGRRKDHQT